MLKTVLHWLNHFFQIYVLKLHSNSMSDEFTIEDIKKFDNEYDVENGLKHIELF